MKKYPTNEELITHLKQTGVLKSAEIENAIRNVLREDFVPESKKAMAYEDKVISYSREKTSATPTTATALLEILQVRRGDKVLEIGAGKGYRTALLSYLVGPTGEVYSYEINPELSEAGYKNLQKYPELARKVRWITGDATVLAKEHAPYGRVLSGAAFSEISDDIIMLLGNIGRMVLPTQHNDIHLYIKYHSDIKEEVLPGFHLSAITH